MKRWMSHPNHAQGTMVTHLLGWKNRSLIAARYSPVKKPARVRGL